jgi:hypothetical protein
LAEDRELRAVHLYNGISDRAHESPSVEAHHIVQENVLGREIDSAMCEEA